MKKYRASREAVLQGVSGGYEDYVLDQIKNDEKLKIEDSKSYVKVMIQEDQDMKAEHEKTPLGMLGTAMQKIKEQRDNVAKRTLKAVNCLMSFEHPENLLDQWRTKRVFKSSDFNYKDNINDPKLPEPPFNPKKAFKDFTEQEMAARKAWKDDMNALSGLAGFCALGLAAKENFGDIVASFFTEGHPDSSSKIQYLKPARIAGADAIFAFVKGNAAKMGELFSLGLRMLNQEVQGIQNLQNEHALGCMFLMDHLMNTAESKTEIKDKLDLNEQELEQINVNRALFKAVYQGRDARTSLMEYAIYKKEMTADELKRAAADILFEDFISKMAADGSKPDFTNSKIVEKVKLELASRNDLNKITTMKREEVGLLAQSMVDFVKGLALQKAPGVNAKQVPDQQPVKEHELKNQQKVSTMG